MKIVPTLKTPGPDRIGGQPYSPCRRRCAADLIIGSSTEPSALDPHFSRTGNNQNVAAQIFDRLITPDPNLQVTPALAESWQNVDPDHMAHQAALRRDLPGRRAADRRGCHLFAQSREGHPEQPGAVHRQCRRDRQHDGDRSANDRVQDEEPDARTSSSRSASSTSSRRSSPKARRSRPSTIGPRRSAPGPTR